MDKGQWRAGLEEKTVKWANNIRKWNLPWKTGIFPAEIAVFLGLCDLRKIRTIVDSGRGPHAYSTHVFGEFSELTGVNVISLDFVPIEQRPYFESLRKYKRVTCIAGNAFEILAPQLTRAEKPIALLIDGPKRKIANKLSIVASILFDIDLIAHHNCSLSEPWGKQFSGSFEDAFHYESLSELARNRNWQEFKKWEKAATTGDTVKDEKPAAFADRSLEQSSLAIGYAGCNHNLVSRVWKAGLPGYFLLRHWRKQAGGGRDARSRPTGVTIMS